MGDNFRPLSRRRVLRFGALTAGAGAIGSALAIPALAESSAAGGDGASAGDPRVRHPFQAPLAGSAQTSYNGWPVGTPASVIDVVPYLIPGTPIPLSVRSGEVATVLLYVAGLFNAQVQPVEADQVGGYEYRRNVNNPNVWSNHASGTAIDLNSTLHPNGRKGTFTPAQVAAIRRILTYCNGVVFWGGDYTGVVDEMHFEINVPPGDPALAALTAVISRSTVVSLGALANGKYVTAGGAGSQPLIANRTAIGPWEQYDLISEGGANVAFRAHANGLYVCADRAGNDPLMANRTAIGPWETFVQVINADGTSSFRAVANGRFVTAEGAGAQSLIANRTAIGPWEKFQLIGY